MNANNGSAHDDTFNLSPDWTTPIDGLKGLAVFTMAYYNAGRTTPYLMRFDIDNAISDSDPIQYSTSSEITMDIGGTYFKRIILNQYYKDGELKFYIPVFEDVWKNK